MRGGGEERGVSIERGIIILHIVIGAVVLMMIVGILVIAVLCWVSISKRSSRRQGRTQWHHPGEDDQIDASLSTQSLPDKVNLIIKPD